MKAWDNRPLTVVSTPSTTLPMPPPPPPPFNPFYEASSSLLLRRLYSSIFTLLCCWQPSLPRLALYTPIQRCCTSFICVEYASSHMIRDVFFCFFFLHGNSWEQTPLIRPDWNSFLFFLLLVSLTGYREKNEGKKQEEKKSNEFAKKQQAKCLLTGTYAHTYGFDSDLREQMPTLHLLLYSSST